MYSMEIMKTDTINNVNFNAKYIDKAIIRKRTGFFYRPYKASIVALDRFDSADKKAIETIASDWGNRTVIRTILLDPIPKNEHIIAITTQNKKTCENIDPKSILALAQYNEQGRKKIILSRFQVNPVTKYASELKREYKRVGETLLEKIKQIKYKRKLKLESTVEGVPFYEKYGFKHERDSYYSMYCD